MAKTETRRTDWLPCEELDRLWRHNFTHYRIEQSFSDGLMLQRHEWKRADGSTTLDCWIRGVQSWLSKAEPIEQQES